jgi:hypothetical protein
LTDIDEQGIGNLVALRESELSVDRISHGLSENWGIREVGIQSLQDVGDDLVTGTLEARIFSWLTAIRTSPASGTRTSQGRSSTAGSPKVTVCRAVVTSGRNDVVRIQSLQETLSTAVRRRNSGGVFSDTQLGNTTNEASIILVGSPQGGTNRLELVGLLGG